MERCEQLTGFIVAELLNYEHEISPDDELLVSGLLDSLAIVQLVEYIEGEFNVSIPPQDLRVENFASVSTIVDYLSQLH